MKDDGQPCKEKGENEGGEKMVEVGDDMLVASKKQREERGRCRGCGVIEGYSVEGES